MAERLRLKLVRVPIPETIRYRTRAELPARCPRAGCGALLKPWPDGKVCSACGRVLYLIRESTIDVTR